MASAFLKQWGRAALLADEGRYFIAVNPTAGTGIATAAAPTADSDTAVFMVVYNANASGGPSIVLDYLWLQATAAGTAGASLHFTHQIDTGDRYSSGGSELTPVNVNYASNRASQAAIRVGAVTAAAASKKRKFGHRLLRNVIPVVGDTYQINFGGNDRSLNSLAVAGVAISNVQVNTNPVEIGPGQSWVFTLYLPSQSAASSYEVELGYAEVES